MDRLGTTAAIVTLGCKTNQFESHLMEQQLKAAGLSVIPFEQGAELVVVNTCTVTSATDAQSRNLVRRCRRLNPRCRIVVTGCYAQVRPQVFSDLPGVALVLGNEEKSSLVEFLAAGGESRVQVSDIRSGCGGLSFNSFPATDRSRAYLQIQNGCDAFCTYCIIPYARGPSRSLPLDQVLVMSEKLAARGFAEVILTGIHIGCYGRDLDPPLSLWDLVRALEQQQLIPRLRLGSIEPQEIPENLIAAMARSRIICPHFHIPLQSGDDAVLKRMGRHYGREFFHRLVARIHALVPDAAIGLDVMAGFPGETEAEFRNSCDLVAALPVSYLHVFPFSRRPGTPAAAMGGQIPAGLIRERAALLRDLGEQKRQEFLRRFVGKRLQVLVEGESGSGLRHGLSGNYLPVFFVGGACREQLIEVDILKVSGTGLEGVIASGN
ncbi:MAG: tRNA (N(6)-L-threonylcarbamoyladenosine(37)-C(2))-methylthiotransferase MtaB [Deltaproteobacteria bacterium]|nr:tRNA (N(6)-L-threonylcarbamoyladenosine(37)-C(2))-methylthiotransferase MtaB [Deltaproteobacteria bacterium]